MQLKKLRSVIQRKNQFLEEEKIEIEKLIKKLIDKLKSIGTQYEILNCYFISIRYEIKYL